jgi:sodium-dependent dicarboxylate transporter 2/3/5
MAGYLSKSQGIEITFLDWMKYGMPITFILLTMLYFFFIMQLRSERGGDKVKVEIENKAWTKNQVRIIIVFLIVVVLWSFRPILIDYINFTYGDEHVAMLAAILMFILPSTEQKPMLAWKDTEKLPWGVLLLFGGGFALAKMLENNGVIVEVVELFKDFETFTIGVLLLVLVGITIFGTEIMSNTAMVSVFIPIIATFAVGADLSVVALCVPVALSASCAFMLPIGTPPNAIVFSGSDLTIKQMIKTGFVLNIVFGLVVAVYAMLFIH